MGVPMPFGSAYLGERSFGQSSKSCGHGGLRARVCVLPQLSVQAPFPVSPASGQENPGEAGLESCSGNAVNPVFLAFLHLCSLLLELCRNKEKVVGARGRRAVCLETGELPSFNKYLSKREERKRISPFSSPHASQNTKSP